MNKNGVKIAVIDWIDSSSRDMWHDRNITSEPVVVVSVGIIIDETKSYITICRSQTEEDQDSVLCIPRSAIIGKIKILRR